jgi:cytochrome c-type biogenesis protein CcmH
MLAEAVAAREAPSGTPPGPGRAELEAAERLSPEERAAMIEGMVARLEDRLKTEGGTAEEWLRLIRSFVQLDRPEDAKRAYGLAAAALADDPSAGFVREQAILMGVRLE